MTINNLYNGNITILFNNNARNRYVIKETGKSPVGVTTVLQTLNKPALMTWPMNEAIAHLKINIGDYEGAAKAYLRKSDKGMSIGTEIHSFVEDYLNLAALEGVEENKVSDSRFPLELKKPVEAFLRWFWEVRPKPLAVERVVYSRLNDYAGTYDCLLEIDDKVILCDIKTNNASLTAPLGVYSEHFLQLGAYSLAHHEENPLKRIEDLMIIRVGKDGKLNTIKASEVGLKVPDCEQGFVQVLKTYKLLTPLAIKLKEMK